MYYNVKKNWKTKAFKVLDFKLCEYDNLQAVKRCPSIIGTNGSILYRDIRATINLSNMLHFILEYFVVQKIGGWLAKKQFEIQQRYNGKSQKKFSRLMILYPNVEKE